MPLTWEAGQVSLKLSGQPKYMLPKTRVILFHIHRACFVSSRFRGTQSVTGPRWPGHYFCQFWKEFTSTRNQTNGSATSRNPLQSCLLFHSILDLLQKTSVSRACLVTCKSAKKWYLMRMCISWLCPFKERDVFLTYGAFFASYWPKEPDMQHIYHARFKELGI